MTKFRPCIDLHAGAVKQIVGGTLTTTSSDLQTNFTSEHGAAFYADLYKRHDLRGGHVIMLGPGNDQASKEALAAWSGGLQVGGGIKDTNAQSWIDIGAEKVGNTCYSTCKNYVYACLLACLCTSIFLFK
jgi:phosphoribosylformimino-5-aminoimidazole carboxamide ribotide isomerase